MVVAGAWDCEVRGMRAPFDEPISIQTVDQQTTRFFFACVTTDAVDCPRQTLAASRVGLF